MEKKQGKKGFVCGTKLSEQKAGAAILFFSAVRSEVEEVQWCPQLPKKIIWEGVRLSEKRELKFF